MALDPLFPGMIDTAGALLPALVSLGIVLTGRARSGLATSDQFWLFVLSLALTAVLARVAITPEGTAIHIVPGATLFLCYLVWCGHSVSPGLAFALTYATCLPVDVFVARLTLGPVFDSECIGGGGWCDGLLILPALTALAILYANWRIRKAGRPRLLWFEQRTADPPRERKSGELNRTMVAGS